MIDNLLLVGIITTTHGLKGEVKVFPTTDDPKRFSDLKEIILDTEKDLIPLKITSIKYHKNTVIIKFKGYNDINDIEQYKGKKLYVTRENAVKCEEDEYFIADLIGLTVFTDEDENLGTLSDVITTGANDVYAITNDEEELLLPAIKDCILNIDLNKNKMTVHMMNGLRER